MNCPGDAVLPEHHIRHVSMLNIRHVRGAVKFEVGDGRGRNSNWDRNVPLQEHIRCATRRTVAPDAAGSTRWRNAKRFAAAGLLP
jgi:hypothetical protein